LQKIFVMRGTAPLRPLGGRLLRGGADLPVEG